MKRKLIIFDLDGVLINSLPNMKYSMQRTNKELKIKIDFNEYKKYLGLPFEKIMKKIGVKKNVLQIKKTYNYFSKKKIKEPKINKKTIKDLKILNMNYDFAIFTSKDKKRTTKILNKYNFLKIIITADDVLEGKPSPEGIYKILKKARIKDKKNCIYVGDSIYDYQSSKKANIDYLHASWGYDKNLNKIEKIKKITNLLQIKNFI
ncbi:HAD family hydrolase [Candidatus Pelagibacter sp.]|jgi:HAD superfamily hydrolase (TIGR01549 family)|nr:HAD family hydrolase [Candidatus Pelagibacter sp.]MDC1248460.1 HAD family hydrolase [Pelagibacteraceae bacterium]